MLLKAVAAGRLGATNPANIAATLKFSEANVHVLNRIVEAGKIILNAFA
jgi:hypothetical protein